MNLGQILIWNFSFKLGIKNESKCYQAFADRPDLEKVT